MPRWFDPRLDILPEAQKEIWPLLASARSLSFVLYGGTAIALQLGHRQSVDFDFFRSAPLDKDDLRRVFAPLEASTIEDETNTLALVARTTSGEVRIAFYGKIGFGRLQDPLLTRDEVLQVASLDDLMATKLKTILDRAEAKDYRDIAAMLRHGTDLASALSGFKAMFNGEPATVLRALGFFSDGDLGTLSDDDREIIRQARDGVRDLPDIRVVATDLAPPLD